VDAFPLQQVDLAPSAEAVLLSLSADADLPFLQQSFFSVEEHAFLSLSSAEAGEAALGDSVVSSATGALVSAGANFFWALTVKVVAKTNIRDKTIFLIVNN